MNLSNRSSSILGVPRGSVFIRRIDDIDQMVRNPAPFGQRDFVGADVESTVNGRGIAVDNLSTVSPGEAKSERALPRSGRPEHRHNNGRSLTDRHKRRSR